MTTVVDTVVPVARGQIRRLGPSGLAFVVLAPHGDISWRVMLLTGPMRTDVVPYPGDWIERWSEVVGP